ncbi:MAG: HNH endonuclease [Candidatus Latescibacteria bacterium]|nr:HNH endonuclease [Candidatus Latescibacterota bacterium]
MLNSQVLLLNQNFEPLTICTAKRAIVMVWAGKAEIIESNGHYVHTVSMEFKVPSIIRLLIYIQSQHRWNIQLSKPNILKRDHRTCQYCGTTEGYMTVDHVIPKSLGGSDTWENLVCACSACNNRKGDRTPEQAGLKLLKEPQKPHYRTFLFCKSPLVNVWLPYLRI